MALSTHRKDDETPDEKQKSDYLKVHTGPNESIPDPEAKGNHLTADELDFTGDHAKHEAKVSQAGEEAANADKRESEKSDDDK